LKKLAIRFILASSNAGKAKEITRLIEPHSAVVYSELIKPFAIDENGGSFKENALIKARAVFEAIGDVNAYVLSDDSGIVVPILGENVPGIYSARYAGENASDRDNLDKLIADVKAKGVDRTDAYYIAAIAIKCALGEWTAHGRVYGEIVTSPRGSNGFGYDPLFIPEGYDRTFGELSYEVKALVSHRARAIENMKSVVSVLLR
jgi:XTP/dITP diphosphohydrolase